MQAMGEPRIAVVIQQCCHGGPTAKPVAHEALLWLPTCVIVLCWQISVANWDKVLISKQEEMHTETFRPLTFIAFIPLQISVAKGDKVLFSKQGSSDVPVPEGEVCFVQQRSVMAKLS